MTIIIKEISIRATIERTGSTSASDDRKLLRMKKDMMREVREMLRNEKLRKAER